MISELIKVIAKESIKLQETKETISPKEIGQRIYEPDVKIAKYDRLETLIYKNECIFENLIENNDEYNDISSDGNENNESDSTNENNEGTGLTEDEKAKLKEETGWPDDIIDAIGSMEEAEIYKNANLQVAEINGKKCLIRTDVDLDQKDEFGRTNKERMENGQPPITKSGETIELHHIGQHADSPLAELTKQEHRGVGNDTVLHDKQKTSEIDRNEFKKEREQHWEDRAEISIKE